MRKAILVFQHVFSVCVILLTVMGTARPAWAGGLLGTVIPLRGHISEIVLDEPRAALYAANFTAGQVDVISTTSNPPRLISSIKIGGQPSGAALSPDGRYLVVTNYNNFNPGNLSSVSVIDLVNNLTVQNYALSFPALAVAFSGDGAAYIITTQEFLRFRPAGGTFETVCQAGQVQCPFPNTGEGLPVPTPTSPREITRASMTASGDGNFIFGVTDSFVFSFPLFPSLNSTMNVRDVKTLNHTLSPPLVSAAFDGSYFMAGQYLLDRRLRVLAEHPDSDLSKVVFGSHAIDFAARRVYASYAESETVQILSTPTVTCTVTVPPTCTVSPGLTTITNLLPPKLFLQDPNNLTTRDELVLPEYITGRMALGGGGRYIYAVSQSGVLYLPVGDLGSVPQVRPSTEQLFFQFDFCQRTSQKQQFRIEGAPGTDFSITTTLAGGAGAAESGVSFNPSRGTVPATVEVTVDFNAFARVQGTTHGQVVITSGKAVNVVNPRGTIAATIQLDINVKDEDQRGRVVPLPGKLVDVLADPGREQFYVLEQTKNELHVFQNSDLRLMATYRTGNRPTWMTLSADRRYLVVANSSGENLTVINLDTGQNQYLFLPPGHYPVSVAADNGTALAAVRLPSGSAQIDSVDVGGQIAYSLRRLGVYQNLVNPDTAMVPLFNMSGIVIAQADGSVMLWDAASQEVVIARQDLPTLRGAIAAGPTAIVVNNNILNLSLVRQAVFTDEPNQSAGFTFAGDRAIRTSSPGRTITGTGVVQRIDVRTPATKLSPVRMVEAPLTPLPSPALPFLRSLAALRNGSIISTSSSGLMELPGNFDAGINIPRVSAITSAADFTDSLASGGLVSIFGQNLAPSTAQAGSLPLPTSLSDVCVTVNGLRVPLLYVSPGQINGQLPFDVTGQVSAVLHTPGGLSDIFYAEVQPAAPAVFQLSFSGQPGKFPAVIRNENNQLATLSNPLRPNETFTIYASGLGEVGPAVESGTAAPSSPLAVTRFQPHLLLGETEAGVLFAGLAPGFVGLYQINGLVPGNTPLGTQIPLTIVVGGASTTVNVRIVK